MIGFGDILLFLVIPVGMLTIVYIVEPWQKRKDERLRQIIREEIRK